MDFDALVQDDLPTLAADTTERVDNNTNHDTINTIMEYLGILLGSQLSPLLHLFMVLNDMGGNRLGVGPAIILTAFGFVWFAERAFNQVYSSLQGLVKQYFTSEVCVSDDDEIFEHMIDWIAHHPDMASIRFLRVRTHDDTLRDADQELVELKPTIIGADGSGVKINFSNDELRRPPRFTPSQGMHSFRHEGRSFDLVRSDDPMASDGGFSRPKEILSISCYGRSAGPIKKLLEHAKQQFYSSRTNTTTVNRPYGLGSRHSPVEWAWIANRHVRPMNTVVLDAKQKIDILSDMNEYLSPATPAWYARRGIPLRRGYLFHGPPGTGKTSLSFALAGVFGLNIFVISLLDPLLGEQDLLSLFNLLPTRCIILLEDIDTAGIARSQDNDEGEKATNKPANEAKRANRDKEGEDYTKNKEEDDINKKDAKKNGEGKKSKKANNANKEDTSSGSDSSDSGYQPNYDSSSDFQDSDTSSGGEESQKKKLNRSHYPPHKLSRQSSSRQRNGISLSGLLNAIDGVASQEGRVLIMTTNKPEALDEALIRPGRVDLQVCFTNATRKQAKELFIRMYVADSKTTSPDSANQRKTLPTTITPEHKDKNGDNLSASSSSTAVDNSGPATPAGDEDKVTTLAALTAFTDEPQISTEELERVAAAFAARIPDGQLISPAEIQGYLLKRKKAPRRAAAEVDVWVKGLLEQKAKKTKLLAVQ